MAARTLCLMAAWWSGVVLGVVVASAQQPDPGRFRGNDGAEMVVVPAGEFTMGSNELDGERPPHRVHLDGYRIDKYEVTNTLYKRFLDATGWAAPLYWSDANRNGPSQPVVGVSWHDADAYCRWAGKRLPTEAEWEKAARGGDERRYPWGEDWDQTRANGDMSKTTRPVGSYPNGVSPYGVHDMAGNVREWVADWYGSRHYARAPQKNPTGPASGEGRVLRGGSWSHLPMILRSASRDSDSPEVPGADRGFRCAKGTP